MVSVRAISTRRTFNTTPVFEIVSPAPQLSTVDNLMPADAPQLAPANERVPVASNGGLGSATLAAQLQAALAGRVQANTASGHPMLQRGAQGAAVAELQRKLQAAGFDPGPIDGDFGPRTEAAVLAFQRSRGIDVDGIVGPQTWGTLDGVDASPVAAASPTTGGAGPLLRQGSQGEPVRALQSRLQELGFDPGPIDGDFGPRTLDAVTAFQRARGLEVDGIVGPQTWNALGVTVDGAGPVGGAAPTAGSARERLLQVAAGEVGTLETGTNTGLCEKYPNYFGRGAESWCADFVSYCMTKAGMPLNDPWCPSIVNKFQASGQWKGNTNPQAGDIVLFDWNGDGVADHVGIVKGVNGDGSIQTIEGNTGNANGQEGVWDLTRSRSTVLGFANPD